MCLCAPFSIRKMGGVFSSTDDINRKFNASVRKWWKKVCGSENPERRITIEEVAKKANYGDLFLTMGNGISSQIIVAAEPFDSFSHVMIVVPGPKDPRTGEYTKCLSDAYSENTGDPCYPIHQPKYGECTGVQFVEIEERLRNYSSGKIVYRPRDPSVQLPTKERIREFVEIVNSWGPDRVPWYYRLGDCWNFVENVNRMNDDDDIRPERTARGGKRQFYVCSAWVAKAMVMLGLMDYVRRPENYNLGDFGGDTGKWAGLKVKYQSWIKEENICFVDTLRPVHGDDPKYV